MVLLLSCSCIFVLIYASRRNKLLLSFYLYIFCKKKRYLGELDRTWIMHKGSVGDVQYSNVDNSSNISKISVCLDKSKELTHTITVQFIQQPTHLYLVARRGRSRVLKPWAVHSGATRAVCCVWIMPPRLIIPPATSVCTVLFGWIYWLDKERINGTRQACRGDYL